MNQDRLEAICDLIMETCLTLPRTEVEQYRPDICKNILKIAKLSDSIGRRYRENGEAAGYDDKTKYLGHKARELGRQIGLRVDTSRYPLVCHAGARSVALP